MSHRENEKQNKYFSSFEDKTRKGNNFNINESVEIHCLGSYDIVSSA